MLGIRLKDRTSNRELREKSKLTYRLYCTKNEMEVCQSLSATAVKTKLAIERILDENKRARGRPTRRGMISRKQLEQFRARWLRTGRDGVRLERPMLEKGLILL